MDTSLIPNIELFIAEVAPFNHLPKAAIKEIAHHIEIIYLPEQQDIQLEHNGEKFLHIVRLGSVEQKNLDGQLRGRLEIGAVFGFSLFEQNEQPNYRAYTLENCLLYRISYPFLTTLLQQYPDYASYFAENTSDRLSYITEKKLNQHTNNIFMQPVSEVANSKVAQVECHFTIQQTAEEMCKKRRSSALIMDNGRIVGIVNDRDMTKRVVAQGINIQQPITTIMQANPPTIYSSDLVLSAVSLMMQHNIRSLPVLNHNNEVVSVLTATDLVNKNSVQSVFLVNRIFQTTTLPALIELSKTRHLIFEALLNSGVNYDDTMQVMTIIADAFNQKLLMMAEHYLGTPPCDYVWAVAGSQARYEIQPLSDQDNFIILARDISLLERDYFIKLSRFVNDGLDKCGYPLCTGGYMASTQKWCQSLAIWQDNFSQWCKTPEQANLLHTTVLMDMRAIYGKTELVTQLQDSVNQLTQNNRRFLSFLVANAVRVKPPLGIFKNFVLIKDGEHKNKLNLKKRAVSLLVDLARIYAIVANLPETLSTTERFKQAYQQGVITQTMLADILSAYHFICDVRFKYQLQAIQQQEKLTHHIDPNKLNLLEKNNLKDAFRLIAKLQEAAEIRFSQKGLIR